MKDFLSPHNVTFDWENRFQSTNEFTLYVSDSLWVFKTNDYYEFYYNPIHYIGKIRIDQMPEIVENRIKSISAIFTKKDIKYGNTQSKLKTSNERLGCIDKNMRIGNWFHAQGQNYVTWKGKFICDDVYVQNCERECSIHEIDGALVYDMVRMGCMSRTAYYIRNIFDFNVFTGVDVSEIEVLPFNEEWDASSWSDHFNALSDYIKKYKFKQDIGTLKVMRTDVFFHTINIVRKGYYMLDGLKFEMPASETREMIENSVFYSKEITTQNIQVSNFGEILDTSATITEVRVENLDCLLAANELQKKGYNVAVLNMANRQNPGGGVYGGAGAQEENIFRRSNIHLSMFQYAAYAKQYHLQKSVHQYPLDRNFGGIYTPNAYVFRGEETAGYPLLGKESFFVSFISVPGINCPDLTKDGMIAEHLIEPYKNKIRTIYRIGLINNHDALVLGALGCGAFHTPPKHMAKLFHEVLKEDEFNNKFRLIFFAIKEDHNSCKEHNPEGNYKPFKDEFKDF